MFPIVVQLQKFGLIVLENQLFKLSIVNFSSTENNSAREVDFSRARTAVAVLHLSADRRLFIKKWNMFTLKVAKVVNFISFLLEAPENYNFIQI